MFMPGLSSKCPEGVTIGFMSWAAWVPGPWLRSVDGDWRVSDALAAPHHREPQGVSRDAAVYEVVPLPEVEVRGFGEAVL